MREDSKTMATYGVQTESQNVQRLPEGVVVTGEAVRGIPADTAEFLIEITASGTTATHALRDNQVKSTQVAQALSGLNVQPADLQTISLNVYNLYAPAISALPGYGAMQQIGQAAFAMPEVQLGSYHARKTVRVNVRDTARVGEVADAAVRAGATLIGTFNFRPADEAAARRSALEAAGKDARTKAEALASAAGKQLGDPISISEDVIASNGTYAALRNAAPFAFGPGTPQVTGDLEYYARVSARFKFQ